MDDRSRGALTAAGLPCGSCGTEVPPNSKFCNDCGAPLTHATRSAEYKQVTVLFADVVHSMDIAAAVGAERLREIMAEVVDRAAVVVQHFGGTVGSFTGDGIMAVFGAPTALEDHAIRACLAALGIQEKAKRLASDVRERDGVELRLRVGLNSGEVIAGEIGSGPFGYTAIGEQVGMAQRMESVAPPGGVMLSASTVRLVDGAAVLGEPELVRIKGADEGVPARRLLRIGDQHRAVRRTESNLVGRHWEMNAVEGLLDRAVDGHGAVVGVVGPPGIGKSRLVREVATKARRSGVDVFTAFCESHTSQVPFHAVARLLRAATGVEGLDGQTARDRVRDRIADADPEDVLLFDDLLGIADPNVALPRIDPDARRRRLTALVNAASLASQTPAVYVVEDAHWIDAVSESMLADFVTVIPQTPSGTGGAAPGTRRPSTAMTSLSAHRPKDGNPSGEAPSAEVIEPHCRICQDHRLRRRANALLDWRGIPIMMGDRTRMITYRAILSWLNQGRPREDRISYDSLWVHARRHYSLAGIVAYWSARMDKEWRDALEALRSTGNQGDSTPSVPESSLDSRSQSPG